MRIWGVGLMVVFFNLFGESTRAQDLFYSGEGSIKDVRINSDGRIHILTNQTICTFEGNQLVKECLLVQDEVNRVVPIEDDLFALISDYTITMVVDGVKQPSDTLPELITCAELGTHQIYIGTAGDGLYEYRFRERQLIRNAHVSGYVNALLNRDGTIWCASDESIVLINPKRTKRLSTNYIIERLESLDSGVVASTSDQKLIVLMTNGEIVTTRSLNQPIRGMSSSLNCVYVLDKTGIKCLNNRLDVRNEMEGEFQALLALSNTLLIARNDRLMTWDITSNVMHTMAPVTSILAVDDSTVWIGMGKTVECWRQHLLIDRYTLPDVISGVSVSSMALHKSTLFVGTLGAGFFTIDLQRHRIHHNSISGGDAFNNILSLSVHDNLLWVTHLNGLLSLRLSDFQLQEDFSGLTKGDYVFTSLIRSHTDFLIGTSTNGLIHYNEGKRTEWLSGMSIYSICAVADTIYVGTKKNGLFRYIVGRKPTQICDLKDIQGITTAGNQLVLSASGTNYFFNPRTGSQLPIKSGDLENMQFNATSRSATYCYMGYGNGYLRMDVRRVSYLEHFGLHLNDAVVFDQKHTGGAFTLKPKQNSIAFTFHPTLYYQTDLVVFKYRLLGLDSSWETTHLSKANYFNLAPGKYVFEVSLGWNSDFHPHHIERQTFTIIPPIWRRSWFMVAATVVLILLVLLAMKWREKQIRRSEDQKRERIRFELEQLKNQVDPHFLFNSLNSLIGLIEENPPKAAEATERLSEVYRNILRYEGVELIDLQTEINLASDYFFLHQLRYEELIEMRIDEAVQKATGKIVPLTLQFLIENAIKHTIINAAHQLVIHIHREEDYLIISNPKNPKPPGQVKHSGIGLPNLENQYKLLSSSPVMIEDHKEIFTVHIPIIYG